jgi:putative transposase
VKYAWIRERDAEFSVASACRVLNVSPSGYYGWLARRPGPRERRRADITRAVIKAHSDSRGVYGYRKVHEDLVRELRMACCRETVRRIMRRNGLAARAKRRFVKTTDADPSLPVAENILGRDFAADEPNRKWVADITYIRTLGGWLYLSVVMDLFSRRIVGWAMSDAIDSGLACAAMNMAIKHRCPGADLLHHSDRGSQYASAEYRELLEAQGIRCSMSRKGDCWDNACAERFFLSLKTEWTGDTIFPDRETARSAVFEYIELFYNRQRRHAALGYVSPAEFEMRGA